MDSNGPQGFELEVPGGWVFEIGNEWLIRRLYCINGSFATTSLSHGVSSEEYLETPLEEFAIILSKGNDRREVTFRDFTYVQHSILCQTESERLLRVDLETDFEGSKLPVSVFYQAQADKNFMRKWIEMPPTDIPGWIVESVTIENLKLKEMIEGIEPLSRYPQKFPNGEDNVHVTPDEVHTDPAIRKFSFGNASRSILAHWGLDEGLFFFMESILGSESFDRSKGMVMRQQEYTPLTKGLVTGAAVIGAYSGVPEIGFKRYTEFLSNNWCVASEKPTPVTWNTWFVTLKNNTPLLTNYDWSLILDYLELIHDAGFYDILHLDLGWEDGWPMAVDRTKFPHGMDKIVHRAKEYGIDMGFWVNPFSSNYWKSDVEDEHPEWLNPGKVSGQSSAHAICHLTDYFEYVKKRFIELVTRFNAKTIYWDGGDWNIPECSATNHAHSNNHELEVLATKRLVDLVKEVRETRPDVINTGFNLPFDNHRLCAFDREQVSDTYAYPMPQSELIQRQQIYQMTFEHPYNSIRGSWHGVDWQGASDKELLKRSMRELIHAEMSMIGNGAAQAGASIDLSQAKPEFVAFLRKMFAWRKRFEKYFTVYQHVLNFPDGENIEGEGHMIDGKGFLVLINPTNEEMSINLPLEEVELELQAGHKYEISDWSKFEQAVPLDKVRVGDNYELDFGPLEVRIIGIGIS